MKVIKRLALCTALLLAPTPAFAEWYVFPFAAVNMGGDTTQESGAFGGALGWMGRWVAVEGEIAVSPSFFENDGGFRTARSHATYTGTALVGPRIDRWRPYASVGLGWSRTHIEEVGGLASLEDDRAAVHVGGGLMWDASRRIGLRSDLRYIRALDDTEAVGNVFPERLAEFSYWRLGGGVTVKW